VYSKKLPNNKKKWHKARLIDRIFGKYRKIKRDVLSGRERERKGTNYNLFVNPLFK
jgi:hypothetical protein